jgi:hypothetical protein
VLLFKRKRKSEDLSTRACVLPWPQSVVAEWQLHSAQRERGFFPSYCARVCDYPMCPVGPRTHSAKSATCAAKPMRALWRMFPLPSAVYRPWPAPLHPPCSPSCQPHLTPPLLGMESPLTTLLQGFIHTCLEIFEGKGGIQLVSPVPLGA